ncbi:MAG: indolepyruvate oxidoreductase subunit beta [Phycisphaerae bacterium]
MTNNPVTNVVIAGLGGQGVLKASDILSEAAFTSGLDVKKSELHGMSQRGGSVTSDVRFGESVASPMVPVGEADYLVVLSVSEIDFARPLLRQNGGTMLSADLIDEDALANRKSLNVAMLGALSTLLNIPAESWHQAIRANLPEKVHQVNIEAFNAGRDAQQNRSHA